MTGTITMRPIGRVVGGRFEMVDDGWGSVPATIQLDPAVVEAGATDGLTEFSHVEVVFCFDRVDENEVCRGTRHPRGRTDWPSVGILAQRAKDRPNRIGVTVCRIVRVGPHEIEVSTR
jgi:tRNA (Thr-GGU) A37 N-methylase